MIDILLKPHISEKTVLLNKLNKFVFVINPKANKSDVKTIVEKTFKVDVLNVNICKIGEEIKKNHSKGTYFKRKAKKKAIVTLKEGQTIPFFDMAEEKK